MKAILGKKIGMTRVFDDKSNIIPVTLIKSGPCYITQIKKADKNGYSAVQLGFVESKKLNKPQKNHLKTAKKELKELKEIAITADDEQKYSVGQEIKADIFKSNDLVDITGISKGKGFAGTTKRHAFHLGPKSHGSHNYRKPGSIGNRFPQRVVKGKRMAGHLGAETATVQKLQVVDIDADNDIISVKGAVPGPKNSLLFLRATNE